ncbi:patatin-like phospholipase family protein [[Ruminococcus] torques]|uniref:patatin-like phospholipase family protein n=1 Tax=[Ruminococcus] torques TaxID=33039 RepID=UPI0027B9AC77|nr:patatin family protein [[Ruminococcus] torques]
MTIKKATLVLEGGATRGIFTSGALDYLMERDLYFSDVIGVSAGSCNAVDYVSRQPGRTRDCMIPTDKEGKYYYGIRDFVKEKSLMNMDLIFDKYPKELLPFDFKTYFNSEINCQIVTTNCLTGKAEYMTEDSDNDRLMKLCRASSSMPLLTPIVNIDNVPYLDGGLADSVPIRRAQQMENEKIVVILTKNQGYRKSVLSPTMQRVYKRAYKSYPNLIRTIFRRSFEYNKTMNYLDQLEKRGEIFILRPQVKPVSRLERNKETLHAFYEHGYKYTERKFDDLMEYLEK